MKARTGRIVAIAFSVLTLLLVLLSYGIPIPLDLFDARLESIAGRMLDRKVTIAGPVRIRLSPHPVLDFGGIAISDPRDWPGDENLLTISKGEAKVTLLSLLQDEVQIDDLTFEGVDLRLVTRADHTTNYDFPSLQSGADEDSSGYELSGMDYVSLRDVRVSYLDELSGESHVVTVDRAEGRGRPDSPLSFSVHGTLAEQPYSLELTGGSLHDLIYADDIWPLKDGTLELAGMTLDLSGSLVRTGDGVDGHIRLSLSGRGLDGIRVITGLPRPEIGDFSLDVQIGVLPGRFHFTGLELAALNSSLKGDLVLFLNGERPILAGNLTVPAIDPALFSAFGSGEPEDITADVAQDNAAHAPPWDMLKILDADLHLRIGELITNPLQIRDLHATVSLVDGDLIVPYSVTVADAPMSGRLDILTSDPTPAIGLSLVSGAMDLSPLLASPDRQDQLNAQLGPVALNVRSQGAGLQDFVRGVDLNMRIGPTELSTGSGTLLKSEALSLELGSDQALALSGKGDLLGRPFDLQVRVGAVEESEYDGGELLRIRLEACDTELRFDAAQPAEPGERVIPFSLSVTGRELCGYLGPVEAFLGAAVDFDVSGEGRLNDAGWSVDLETVRLGEIVLDARLEQRTTDNSLSPVTATLHSKGLDLIPFLQAPVDAPGPTPRPDQGENGGEAGDEPAEQLSPEQQLAGIADLLTTEIAPLRRFLATDVVLVLQVDTLGAGRFNATNVSLSTEIKEGKLVRAPFQATVAGKLVTGDADIDFTTEVPAIHFKLAAEDISLPDLFREFQLGDAPDLSAKHVGLEFSFRGETIEELLRQSSHKVVIEAGKLMMERELSGPLRIDIDQASHDSTPDTPTTISVSGSVNSMPLTLELTEDGLLVQETSKPFTFKVNAGLGDTELRIDSRVIRKENADNVLHLDTLLSGDRMNSLNEVLGVSLPPLGPYRIEGSLQIEGETVTFHDLVLQVGDSILNGEMVVEVSPNQDGGFDFPVTVRIRLNADSIQLNDFHTGEWLALGSQEKKSEDEIGEAESPDGQQGSVEQLKDLLGPELAAMLRGSLEIEVREVLSGRDNLGGGILNAGLEDGLYSVDALRLDIPGGAVRAQGSLRPGAARTEAGLTMQIEHLDYGVLARRVRPEADMKGELNLNLELRSVADDPLRLKEHVNGRLRIGVVPEHLLAGVVDLWAVNIITAALPTLMKGSKSEVNCLVGDFALTDGIMRPEVFLLDTSKMRVGGKGQVNFKTDAIDFHLKPAPKKAQFFSLATPVSVSGTITEPEIEVTAGGVLGTVARLAGSVITVPYKKLFTDDMAPDGRKACSAAMSWVKGGFGK